MTRILGCTDGILITKGVNVFTMQIEAILFDIEGTESHYRQIVNRVDNIKKRLASELGIGVDVKLVEERIPERLNGKGYRVIDNCKF